MRKPLSPRSAAKGLDEVDGLTHDPHRILSLGSEWPFGQAGVIKHADRISFALPPPVTRCIGYI